MILQKNSNKLSQRLINTLQQANQDAVSWKKARQAGVEKVRKLVVSHTKQGMAKNKPNMKFIDKLEEKNYRKTRIMKQLAYFKKDPEKISIIHDKEVLHADQIKLLEQKLQEYQLPSEQGKSLKSYSGSVQTLTSSNHSDDEQNLSPK